MANFSSALKNYGNDLCRSCNHNQMIIMQLLHAYGNEEVPSATVAQEAEDGEAFEEYKNLLEIKYPLCKLCRGVVRRKLDAQAALARANYLAAQAVRGKVSVLAFNRRISARRRLLFYSLLLVVSLATKVYNYNIVSAFACFVFLCIYPASSIAYKTISFLIFALRTVLLFLIEDVGHSFHQVKYFSLPFNPIIVDCVVHICFINPDMLEKLFTALKPISCPRRIDRKEKKQLQLYHDIITKESTGHNKENLAQRFSPRPSILSIPGTGIEESLALCSLQENSASLTAKTGMPTLNTLFPFLTFAVSFLCYLLICWKLLHGNIEFLCYHAIGLLIYAETVQALFRRNLFFSLRLFVLACFSLMMYHMLLVNWHSTERVGSVFCSFYSITSVFLMM